MFGLSAHFSCSERNSLWRLGLLNPYGLWSPRHSQSDASSSEMEFGTARQYDTTDLFFQEGWLYDDHLFPSKLDDEDDEGKEEDKFVLGVHDGSELIEIGKLGAGHSHRHEHIGNDSCEGCAEVYTCSSPLCGCCGGGLKIDGLEVARSSSSTVYGRYQILDDQTEILDDCAQDGFQFKQSGDVVLECDMPRDPGRGDDDSELSVVEKELQMLSSFDNDAVASKYFSSLQLEFLFSPSCTPFLWGFQLNFGASTVYGSSILNQCIAKDNVNLFIEFNVGGKGEYIAKMKRLDTKELSCDSQISVATWLIYCLINGEKMIC